MTWLEFIAFYITCASMSYFMFFAFTVENNGRIGFTENLLVGALRCLRDDFLRIHCPWSRARSVRYRIKHLWDFVGENGRNHDKLGWLTRAELLNVHRHAEIAGVCFVSRTLFWTQNLFQLLISPVRMALFMAFMFLVMVPVALYSDMRAHRKNKEAAKQRALREKNQNPVN